MEEMRNLNNFNETDVRLGYRFLNHENETEIRLIDPNKKNPARSEFVTNEEEFVKICKLYNSKYNIYAGINERSHLGTKGKNVLSIKSVIIDIDAKRTNMKQAATIEELDKAEESTENIINFLKDFNPCKMMSGNGWQLWHAVPKINITNDNREEIQDKVEQFHKNLIIKFKDDKYIEIDNIGDHARIIKVPGTLSVKGDNIKLRPYRVAYIASRGFRRNESSKLLNHILNLKTEQLKPKKVLIPEPNKDIMEYISSNKKLNKLYFGLWEDRYETRSEAEMALYTLLMAGGYSEIQCDMIMDKAEIGKWREATGQYKELTRHKARVKYTPEIIKNRVEKKKIEVMEKLEEATETVYDTSSFTTIDGKGKEKLQPDLLARNIMGDIPFKTTMEGEDIYYYNDGIYHLDAEVMIKKEAVARYEKITSHQASEVIFNIKALTYLPRSEFNKNKNIIILQNGTYDIEKDTLSDFDPNNICTTSLPVKYDETATCPKFLKFLEEVSYPEDANVIQEMFGYCLYPEYIFHRAFLFVGDGSNGKSTLLSALECFLGDENVAAVAMQSFDRNSFAAAQLVDKLANIFADLPPDAMGSTSTFKMLTGNDTVYAERKFKQPFKFKNFAKLVFSTNQAPKVYDKTSAFHRRMIHFNFPYRFEGDAIDPFLLQKITTPEEISGMFNWAIEGLKRLLKNEKFSYSRSTEENRDYYERMTDPVFAFKEDWVEYNPDSEWWTTKEETYIWYQRYCTEHHLPITASNSVSKDMKRHIIGLTESKKKTLNGRKNGWVGIRINKDKEKEDNDQEDEEKPNKKSTKDISEWEQSEDGTIELR